MGKLGKLTKHHYVTKKKAEFFKQLKENLQFREGVIVLDFLDNYSFSVQGFHWNNSQTIIHPLVIYYVDGSGKLAHKSYACISDLKTHDTIMMHSFLKHYEHYITNKFPFLRKVFYFKDGSASQHKNFKNLTNLIFHQNNFHIQAEWTFFATTPRKNACDRVGGTIKRLAAHASLQCPFSNQILTPKQLFDFAEANVDVYHLVFCEL